MIKSLSILMPSYNNLCGGFVEELRRQAESIGSDGFRYEIIVADDGSPDPSFTRANSSINKLGCCRYIVRKENVGRAAIRNFLASEAQYEYLLFLDSDRKVCSDDFIRRYVSLENVEVACGGLRIGGDSSCLCHNIRYRMEKKYEPHNTAEGRQAREYKNFNTSNFMVRRDIILSIPFDERFRRYGYEDVMWGRQLHDNNIRITHIDNPIMLDDFETNPGFVSKMETGMDTLHAFNDELRGYSAIIDAADILNKLHLAMPYRLLFNAMRKPIRRNLTGERPIVPLLNFYKLGIFINKK